MKRIYARLTALLLLLTVLLVPLVASCSTDEKKGTTPPPATEPAASEPETDVPTEPDTEEITTAQQPDEERLPYLNAVKGLLASEFSIYSTTTEITMTLDDGVVLHAAYEIRKTQITYTEEYLKEYVIGADDEEMIGVRTGVIKSTSNEYEAMVFSDFTLEAADLLNYWGERKGGSSVLTVVFRDDAMTHAFGVSFEGASNVTVTFTYTSSAIQRIDISYDLPGATVKVKNTVTAG